MAQAGLPLNPKPLATGAGAFQHVFSAALRCVAVKELELSYRDIDIWWFSTIRGGSLGSLHYGL